MSAPVGRASERSCLDVSETMKACFQVARPSAYGVCRISQLCYCFTLRCDMALGGPVCCYVHTGASIKCHNIDRPKVSGKQSLAAPAPLPDQAILYPRATATYCPLCALCHRLTNMRCPREGK
jgi:hypothetical protein